MEKKKEEEEEEEEEDVLLTFGVPKTWVKSSFNKRS